MSDANDIRFPSQKIAWDPSAWIGFSDAQKDLIKKGFDFALKLAYEAEKTDKKALREEISRLLTAEGYRMEFDPGAAPGEGHALIRLSDDALVNADDNLPEWVLSLAKAWSDISDHMAHSVSSDDLDAGPCQHGQAWDDGDNCGICGATNPLNMTPFWPEEREATTLGEARQLAEAALYQLGFATPTDERLSQWELSKGSLSPWEYATLSLGGDHALRIGISAGGVVSVNGDPFTPNDRKSNVTLDRVMRSLRHRVTHELRFLPLGEPIENLKRKFGRQGSHEQALEITLDQIAVASERELRNLIPQAFYAASMPHEVSDFTHYHYGALAERAEAADRPVLALLCSAAWKRELAFRIEGPIGRPDSTRDIMRQYGATWARYEFLRGRPPVEEPGIYFGRITAKEDAAHFLAGLGIDLGNYQAGKHEGLGYFDAMLDKRAYESLMEFESDFTPDLHFMQDDLARSDLDWSEYSTAALEAQKAHIEWNLNHPAAREHKRTDFEVSLFEVNQEIRYRFARAVKTREGVECSASADLSM